MMIAFWVGAVNLRLWCQYVALDVNIPSHTRNMRVSAWPHGFNQKTANTSLYVETSNYWMSRLQGQGYRYRQDRFRNSRKTKTRPRKPLLGYTCIRSIPICRGRRPRLAVLLPRSPRASEPAARTILPVANIIPRGPAHHPFIFKWMFIIESTSAYLGLTSRFLNSLELEIY